MKKIWDRYNMIIMKVLKADADFLWQDEMECWFSLKFYANRISPIPFYHHIIGSPGRCQYPETDRYYSARSALPPLAHSEGRTSGFHYPILPCHRKNRHTHTGRDPHRMRKALKKPGLPLFRFHDLRHYSASIMHAIGIPDQYIMRYRGWGSNAVLKAIYRNTPDDYQQNFADQTNACFENMQYKKKSPCKSGTFASCWRESENPLTKKSRKKGIPAPSNSECNHKCNHHNWSIMVLVHKWVGTQKKSVYRLRKY